MSGIARIGVRIVKDHLGRGIRAKSTEVYDLDSGKLLPAASAEIVLDPNSFIMARVLLELDEIEVIEV